MMNKLKKLWPIITEVFCVILLTSSVIHVYNGAIDKASLDLLIFLILRSK